MIHHISIPARDVNHVTKVLAELTGWRAIPFPGPLPGATMLLSDDGQGTGLEIYPDGTALMPGQGDQQIVFGSAESSVHFPFHFLMSLDTDRATVQRIGDREGWRTLDCWRGPPGNPMFELIEFWIENRVMIEIATKDMVPDYVRTTNVAA